MTAQETKLYNRKYYLANRERLLARRREYYKAHRQEYRSRARQFYVRHSEEIKEERRNYYQQHRSKKFAQSKVRIAIASGVLVRQPCQVCGQSENVHGHHDDYRAPLAVRWLCPRCHVDAHGGIKARMRLAV